MKHCHWQLANTKLFHVIHGSLDLSGPPLVHVDFFVGSKLPTFKRAEARTRVPQTFGRQVSYYVPYYRTDSIRLVPRNIAQDLLVPISTRLHH